jgi:Spy/CpxP family protein refolding chaperone
MLATPSEHSVIPASSLDFFNAVHCLQFQILTNGGSTEAFMTKNILRLALTNLLLSAVALSAQSSAPPSGNPPSTARPGPCWRQAGISKSVMEQHQALEREGHSQIAGVCGNSSLTAEQKQQQVRDIRQQTQQKVDALLTPEQLTTLHACQQQRRGNNNGGEGHRAGAGPCGNFAASQGRQGAANGNAGGSPQTPEN